MKIFISYSHKDREFSRRLASLLQDKGIATWIDDRELNIGDSLIEKINEAIHQANVVLIVLSRNTSNSQSQLSEIAMAIAARKKSTKQIVSIVLDKNIALPFFLKDRLYIDVSGKRGIEERVEQISQTLQSLPTASSSKSEELSAIEKIKIEQEMLAFEKKAFEQKRLLRTQTVLASVTGILAALSASTLLFVTNFTDINFDFLIPSHSFFFGTAIGVFATALAAYLNRKIHLGQKQKKGSQNAQ
ncbi:hypothetical protein LCGC14_1904300 [marine sediment metagenome]|uniref:TIR domain-containing protein n=1 Tax=marine sediment metagenome TaxID=412755 RepID=A0A0F9GIW8_9ZZZZ